MAGKGSFLLPGVLGFAAAAATAGVAFAVGLTTDAVEDAVQLLRRRPNRRRFFLRLLRIFWL